MLNQNTQVKTKGKGYIEGFLVVFGSPAKKDKHRQYFSGKTDFALNLYASRPVLWDHDVNQKIGMMTAIKRSPYGLYATARLDIDTNPQARKVWNWIKSGRYVGWSTQAISGVKSAADGHILKWPIAEGSLTLNPSERRTRAKASDYIDWSYVIDTMRAEGHDATTILKFISALSEKERERRAGWV